MKNTYVKNSVWFILIIPVINTIAANTANYSTSDIFNTGTLRAVVLGIFFIYFISKMYPKDNPSTLILFSIFYMLFLVPFSTDKGISLIGISKYSLGVLMFPVGYYFFYTFERYKALILSLIISLTLYLIFIIVSNLLGLGKYDYAAGTFYFGSGSVNITKDIFILVLLAPIGLLLFPNKRNLLIILFLAGLIVAVIGIKRSVLISAILSIIVYLFKTHFRVRNVRLIIGAGALIIFTLLIFPSVFDIFKERVSAREEQLTISEGMIEKETRYEEALLVLNSWGNGSLMFKLFGSEPFNDREYYKARRMLHTDYMVILNGSGAIGIFIWFYIYYAIFIEKKRYRNIIKANNLMKEIDAIFTALLFAQLFMSVSSTVYAISLRGFIFLFWGASLSLMRSMNSEFQRSQIVSRPAKKFIA